MNRARLLSSILLLLTVSTCFACPPGDGARFDQALSSAAAIAIVRVESVSLPEDQRDPLFVASAEADVRIVRVLKGSPPERMTIEFLADRCGGVRLDIGRYYLSVMPDQSDRLVLKQDDERIFALSKGEFSEVAATSSPLIEAMERFVESGKMPESELVWKYFGRTRWPLD